MGNGQIEETVDALLEKLRTRLPDKIAELNAEIPDEHTLVEPHDYTFGMVPEMQFPHVAVAPEGTETTQDSGGRIHYNHVIAVTCWLEQIDPQALNRLLVRYQRALREVVLYKRHPNVVEGGGGGYGLQHREDEYGPPFQAEEIPGGVYVAYATSTFAVQQQQDVW